MISTWACVDKEDADFFEDSFTPGREIAENVDLIYSDSAKIEFRIQTPRMEIYEEENKLVEEYPMGLHIDFYNENKEVISSVDANYAKRISKDGIMTLRDNVILINEAGDKLITTGIQWDESNQSLQTNKFVQLIKVSEKDTFFGIGFEAKDDFSKFSISQFKGKRRYQDIEKQLGLEETE